MPIIGAGWELHIERKREQTRGGARRTVGRYQVYRDGVAATGTITVDGVPVPLAGVTGEPKGPGQNEEPATPDNPSRIRQGRYPLTIAGGPMYKTHGYRRDLTIAAAMPGIGLGETGNRTAIIIHPGKDVFLSSIGCINPTTTLPSGRVDIAYADSRRRVIALIEDMKRFAGRLPRSAGRPIRGAFVVIDGEPGAARVRGDEPNRPNPHHPGAVSNHAWYRKTFPQYPGERRAVIPGLLCGYVRRRTCAERWRWCWRC